METTYTIVSSDRATGQIMVEKTNDYNFAMKLAEENANWFYSVTIFSDEEDEPIAKFRNGRQFI